MRTVFVNPERCIGCRQCEFACAVEHSQSKDPVGAIFERPAPHTRIHVEAGLTPNSAFPNRCRHCQPAPCLQVCPTTAIHRDPLEGVVLVDGGKCIACAMCAIVCPFDALTFHPLAASRGEVSRSLVATKCDGCLTRVRAGREPACVESCKVGALVFGELNELVRSGRQHTSARLLSAAAQSEQSELDQVPAVAAWRSFGTALNDIDRRES
jgi:anaerobic carbon-monoxide dehydrogenase iron sulfur subunit